MQKATCVTILLNGTLPFFLRIDYAEGLIRESPLKRVDIP